jgi:hypothetical protein
MQKLRRQYAELVARFLAQIDFRIYLLGEIPRTLVLRSIAAQAGVVLQLVTVRHKSDSAGLDNPNEDVSTTSDERRRQEID